MGSSYLLNRRGRVNDPLIMKRNLKLTLSLQFYKKYLFINQGQIQVFEQGESVQFFKHNNY